MTKRRVLISGAGVAGASLGFWLSRAGWDVTMVERANGQRSSGNPVDIRGDALGIVREMGVLERLRAAATTARRTVVVAEDGSVLASLGLQNGVRRPGEAAEIEVPRADLAGVLVDAVAADVEIRYGDSIGALEQHPAGVEVVLDSGHQATVDLVIGADGVHSHTRSLAFDRAQIRRDHLGLFVGTTKAPGLPVTAEEVQLYNEPGRMVSIHPGRNSPLVAYLFRRPSVTGFDPRSVESQRAMILDAFDGAGWRTPELLQYTQDADDVYLDAVARVTVPSWHTGRIGLLGDAASCVSLLGDGSSKAIVGAHTLATELISSDDHETAFRRYQRAHQRRVSSATAVRLSARLLVPSTRLGASLRNRAVRAATRVGNARSGRPTDTAACRTPRRT